MPDKKLTDSKIIKAWEDEIHLAEYVDSGFCNGVSLSLVKSTLDLINRQKEKYDHLLKVARKMHSWIFLNTGDEQAAYDEIGLSDEDNMLLGYMGKIMLVEKELTDNDQ